MTELTIYKTEELFNNWCPNEAVTSGTIAEMDLNKDRLMYDIEVTEYYNYNNNEHFLPNYSINKKVPSDLNAVKENTLVTSAYQWTDDKL